LLAQDGRARREDEVTSRRCVVASLWDFNIVYMCLQ
jgi:hypothetical protein